MHWHYRIFKVIPKKIKGKPKILQPQPYYCIKEFFVGLGGKVTKGKNTAWTTDPIAPIADSREELIKCLEMMLDDAKKHRTKVERIK